MTDGPDPAAGDADGGGIDRRTMMKGAGATLGMAAFAKAMAPMTEWAEDLTIDEFLQKHYKELSDDEMEQVLERIERETEEEYGAEVDVEDHRPTDGVKFAYALNLSICIGCRKCAEACHEENNHDRPTNESYIRVFEMEEGSINFEHGNVDYDEPVPESDKYYMPVQCQQCDNPPCVDVCPVEATWKEEDGVVVIDYDWCIGCRYCQAACPYHARRFNWKKPEVPADDVNPDQGYLSNR
ncbi:MAG: 4Fe-4S dicluster domain-containing protein, partial [Bradymonadaceae bacterium]